MVYSFCCLSIQARAGHCRSVDGGTCPSPERCPCVKQHKECFQWELLRFRAFVSWEFIGADTLQCLAVESCYHRKVVGELDSKLRTAWPVVRRGDTCTHLWYKKLVLLVKETSFVSNPLSWFSFGLCIKGQVALLLVLRAFPLADFYLCFLITEDKCSKKALWTLFLWLMS